MSSDAKVKAVEKLDAMRAFDGYSGDLSPEGIEELYRGLGPLKNNTYLANTFTLKEFWVKKYFKTQLGQAFLLPLAVGNFRFDTTVVSVSCLKQIICSTNALSNQRGGVTYVF